MRACVRACVCVCVCVCMCVGGEGVHMNDMRVCLLIRVRSFLTNWSL